MKSLLIFFLLSVVCSAICPVPSPANADAIYGTATTPPESKVSNAIHDNFLHETTGMINLPDTEKIPMGGTVSITDFGAKVDGKTDDFKADSAACAYCIANPKRCTGVVFPVGHSRITKPLLLQNNGQFFTIRLLGLHPAKSASNDYLSVIDCDFKAGYGIGIQLGRGIVIENLSISGKYTFPNSVSNQNIGTLKFSDWIDSSIRDSRYAPYAGISIDPNLNKTGSNGGTSDVTIQNCSINRWMVGIMLTPNAGTANDEMINILEDDIETCRDAIAIGQDQSKTVNIKGLKVWASTHTVLDGKTYGQGTGGGSVFCENWNIAGNVNQLFNLVCDRFPLSAKDIYSESIFRIGTCGGSAGANFINFQIDFLTGPGLPAADYLINGSANFYGGCIRYYDQSPTHRLNFVNSGSMFRDMTLSSEPITAGLYGIPANVYQKPSFDNVHNYVSGFQVTGTRDTLIKLANTYAIVINRKAWIATIRGVTGLHVGDYILGAPNGKYYDQTQNRNRCPTAQIGRVVSVSGTTANLDDVGLNVSTGTDYDNIYIDRIK